MNVCNCNTIVSLLPDASANITEMAILFLSMVTSCATSLNFLLLPLILNLNPRQKTKGTGENHFDLYFSFNGLLSYTFSSL